MVSLDTHKAVTQLQDAGAPEPLARATVDVVEEGVARGTERLVTEATLYKALLALALGLTATNIAIAAATLAIARWMFG